MKSSDGQENEAEGLLIISPPPAHTEFTHRTLFLPAMVAALRGPGRYPRSSSQAGEGLCCHSSQEVADGSAIW